MKLAITGAGGFIGSHVVEAALDRKYEVRILVRSDTYNTSWAQRGVEVFKGDVRDSKALKPFLSHVDYLCHVAGVNTPLRSRQQDLYDSNVNGVAQILRMAAECGVRRIVHTGSTAALGCVGKGRMNNEEAVFNLWNSSGDYERSKYLGEKTAVELFQKEGIPVVIAQPSACLGPGDVKPTYTGQLIIDFITGRLPGYFDARQNFVDVRDVALGHLLALEKGRLGERYLLCNENLLMSEYFSKITSLTGTRAPRIKPPLWLTLMMAYGFEVLGALTRKDPLIRVCSVKRAMLNLYYDNAKARQELGYAPRPILHSLHDEIQWFIQQGYLPADTQIIPPGERR